MIPGWGKCRLLYRLAGSANSVAWTEMPTPVDGTTQVNTTQGEKQEAKVEGGENEAVKYKRNTYQLVFNVRGDKDRTPIANTDGVVSGEYEWLVIPEDLDAVGAYIQKSSVNVQSSFNSTDGNVNVYTADAVKIETSEKKTNLNLNQIHWGVVSLTGDTDGVLANTTKIEFQELGNQTKQTLYQASGGGGA